MLRHVCEQTKVAVDKLEPYGQQTRVLAAISRMLIDVRAKGKKWSASPVPPNLVLPALLFYRPRAVAAAAK